MVIQLNEFKKQVFYVLQPSKKGNDLSKFIDIFLIFIILLNTCIVYSYTFPLSESLLDTLSKIEVFSVIIFTLEYLLRLWTADVFYNYMPAWRARRAYAFSLLAAIDLLAVLPFYLPMVFPVDLTVLKLFTIFRFFQIFKLTRYTSSMRNIGLVLRRKASQLITSILVIGMIITIVSLIMYHIEHDAQPDKFESAFSGMWWAISTLTTVGYGDIYPITTFGRFMAGIISFLGIGFVAVPTAIISSGFIEQMNTKRNTRRKIKEYHYCPHCGKPLSDEQELIVSPPMQTETPELKK